MGNRLGTLPLGESVEARAHIRRAQRRREVAERPGGHARCAHRIGQRIEFLSELDQDRVEAFTDVGCRERLVAVRKRLLGSHLQSTNDLAADSHKLARIKNYAPA